MFKENHFFKNYLLQDATMEIAIILLGAFLFGCLFWYAATRALQAINLNKYKGGNEKLKKENQELRISIDRAKKRNEEVYAELEEYKVKISAVKKML